MNSERNKFHGRWTLTGTGKNRNKKRRHQNKKRTLNGTQKKRKGVTWKNRNKKYIKTGKDSVRK